jgi:DNA-binding FadR family transcriptional regulator
MEVTVSMLDGSVVSAMLSESKKRKKKHRKKKQKSPEMQRRSDMLKVMMPMLSDEQGIKLAKALEDGDGDAAYQALEKMGQTIRDRVGKKKKKE